MSSGVIILVGGCAVGKDLLLNRITDTYGLHKMVSHTTRIIRNNEKHGDDYYYIDNDKFIEMLIQNKFIETRKYNVADGSIWNYGLSKDEIQEGKLNVVIVDAEGAREVKEHCKCNNINCVSIYIKADVKKRIERYMHRDYMSDYNCYEMCRRILSDRELVEPYESEADYVLTNDCLYELEYNIKKVGDIIDNM